MKNKFFFFVTALLCMLTPRIGAQIVGNISGNRGICAGTTPTTLTSPSSGTWSSGDATVATVYDVDPYTVAVTGISAGTAIITHHISPTAETTMVRVIAVGSPFTLSPPHGAYVCVGASWTVNAPTGGTWSSADTNIVTATQIGPYPTNATENATIAGKVAGPDSAFVYCDYPGGCRAQTIIRVGLPDIVGETDICIGEVFDRLTCTSAGLTWTCADTQIADFLDRFLTPPAQSGRLFGITAGTTTVTFTKYAGCYETRTAIISEGDSTTGTLSLCVGATTDLDNVGTGTWTSSNTTVATVNSTTGLVTGVAAGTSKITYFRDVKCPYVVEVSVNPNPSISGSAVVCNGATVTLTAEPGGGTWSSSNANVTVNSSGVVTGVSSGTAVITYMLSTGCYDTHVITSGTTVASISGTATVCAGFTTALTGTPSGGTWSSSTPGKATVDAYGVVTGVAAGTSRITYSAAAGCIATQVVTVGAVPTISSSQSQTVCPDYSITITCSCGSGCTSPTTWSSSNTAILTVNSSGVVTPVAAGTAIVTLTNGSGCTATRSYTVNATPQITAVENTMCKSSTQTLTGDPSGGNWVSTAPGIASVGFTTGVVNSATTVGSTTIKYYTFSNLCIAQEVISVVSCAKIGNTNGGNVSISGDNAGFSISPNPGSGRFKILNLNGPGGVMHVTVVNAIGELIYSADLDFKDGVCALNIPKDKLSSGLHLVSLTNAEGAGEVYRLLIQD